MRIGVLARGDAAQIEWAARLGFRSMEWVGFSDGPCGAGAEEWKPHAEMVAAEAKSRGIRISAIAALYANPLDPRQTDFARATFLRAIEVASHIGVPTVAGFAGAVIETDVNPRGGNPVYKPFENYLPRMLEFWEPVARVGLDKGVRIAFEHCPQGPYHLPIMHYNLLGQPYLWERFFELTQCPNLGIEWDASHLMCQFIDPVENIRRFGDRIFHVHAKDAFINRRLLEVYGICHPGVAEHRMPGFGQANWSEIIHELLRAGYDSDLNIEGRHDPVLRDHEPPAGAGDASSGRRVRRWEDAGLLAAKALLEPLVQGFLPAHVLESGEIPPPSG